MKTKRQNKRNHHRVIAFLVALVMVMQIAVSQASVIALATDDVGEQTTTVVEAPLAPEPALESEPKSEPEQEAEVEQEASLAPKPKPALAPSVLEESNAFTVENAGSPVVLADGATAAEYPHLTFQKDDATNSISIVSCADTVPGNALVIPATIDGLPVLHIGNNVFSGRSLQSVTFEDGSALETIGDNAFTGNAQITAIALPSTVTSIGQAAFQNCTALATINLPDGLTRIAASTFDHTALTSVVIPENVQSIGEYAFNLVERLQTVDFSKAVKLESIGDNAFYACSALSGEIVLPDSVQTIGKYALAQTNLSKVTFGTGIVSIETTSFYNNDKLTQMYFSTTKAQTPAAVVTALGKHYYMSAILHYTDTETVEDFWFDADAPAVAVGYVGAGGAVNVPETYQNASGETVTVTGVAAKTFANNANVTSVTFPSTVTSIGAQIFEAATTLQRVDLSQTSITVVPEKAFYNCFKLEEILLPASVATLGGHAFANSTTYSSELGGSPRLPSIDLSHTAVTKLPPYAFNAASNLETILLPSNLTSIEYNAFYDCKKLKNIDIPDGVASIGSSAFSNCRSLTAVSIPSALTDLASRVFYATGLTSISIPSTVQKISSDTFAENSQLTEIWVDAAEGSITGAKWGANTATVYWNDTIKTDDYVYSSAKKELQKYIGTATDITIPTTITAKDGTVYTVENLAGALYANSAVTSVVVPDAYDSLPDYTFQNCKSLTSLTLPSNMTSIGEYAISDTGITDITLPASLRSIGVGAFQSSKLNAVAFPSGLESIDNDAFKFAGLSGADIVLPESVTAMGAGVFQSTSIGSIAFPSQLTSIAPSMVASCGLLERVTMGDNVTSIGNSAFASCRALVDVQLSAKLEIIDTWAFDRCSALTSIDLPDSVTTIEQEAFDDCTKLADFTLPASLQSISMHSFGGTKPTNLQIPSGVTSIEYRAFTSVNTMEYIYVDQTRGEHAYHTTAPWSAKKPDGTLSPVYFKGEVIVLDAQVANTGTGYWRKIVLSTEKVEGVLVKAITLPAGLYDAVDGTAVAAGTLDNIGTETWNATYYVKDNGTYLFGVTSSNDRATECQVAVDDIGMPVITADSDVQLNLTTIGNMTSAEKLIALAKASATDGVVACPMTISDADVAKVQALSESNPETTITITATGVGAYASMQAQAQVRVEYISSAKVVLTYDGKTVYEGMRKIGSIIEIYNSVNSSVTQTYTVDLENNIALPEPCEKEGHYFLQWSCVPVDETRLSVMVIHGVYIYTVTFDTQGGSFVRQQPCVHGSRARIPTGSEVPTRAGYTLVGWYTTSACDTPFDFKQSITANTTIYAKWEHVHALSYTAQGDVITARCTNESVDCAYHGNGYVAGTATFEEPASFVADDGDKAFSITYDADWNTNIPAEILTLCYIDANGVSTTTAPTVCGSYTVQVLHGATEILARDYVITPAVKTPTDIFKDYPTVSTTYTHEEITFESIIGAGFTFSMEEEGDFAATISFTEENDGTGIKTVYVKDSTGKVFVTTLSYFLENTPPTMQVSGVPEAWQSAMTTITISASDAESGLCAQPYSFDGGATWQVGNAQFVRENKAMILMVKDLAGNTTTHTIDSLLIDYTVPEQVTQKATPATPDGENLWYASAKETLLTVPTAQAGEAPVTGYYKLWQAGETKPSESVAFTGEETLVSGEGTWHLVTYTMDEAGNTSGESAITSWLCDTVAPEIDAITQDDTANVSGIRSFFAMLRMSPSAVFTVEVSDATSGVDAVLYKQIAPDGTETSGTLSVYDGKATLQIPQSWNGDITFTAVDVAGHRSAEKTVPYEGKEEEDKEDEDKEEEDKDEDTGTAGPDTTAPVSPQTGDTSGGAGVNLLFGAGVACVLFFAKRKQDGATQDAQ